MKVLIVDDEKKPLTAIIDRIEELKKRGNGYSTIEYHSAMDFGGVYAHCNENIFDLAIVDYSWNDSSTDGYIIAKFLKEKFPNIFVVIVSGNTEHFVKIKTNESLSNTHYIDFYLPKPITNIRDIEMTIILANLYNEKKTIEKELVATKSINEFLFHYGSKLTVFQKNLLSLKKPIIFNSEILQTCLDEAMKVAKTNESVLITGETGTGKELLASLIHEKSKRKDKPFIQVNCSAIPSELIESTLFGHEKGSFTSSISKKVGDFELAKDGTLFLDEIADMDYTAQSKILTALQNQSIKRVGGEKEIPINIRIIAATNKDLSKEIEDKKFRKDLYFRLKGVPISLPSLTERGEMDIELLSQYFLYEYNTENNLTVSFNNEALLKIKSTNYKFPGNIRELQSMVRSLAVLSDGLITVELISKYYNEIINPLIRNEATQPMIVDFEYGKLSKPSYGTLTKEEIKLMQIEVMPELRKYEQKFLEMLNEWYKDTSGEVPKLEHLSIAIGHGDNFIRQRFTGSDAKNKMRINIAKYLFSNQMSDFKIKELPPFKKM